MPPRDACSGRIRTHRRPQARPCCGRVNRGLAILGDTLFMGTLDGHLLAIDAKTGGLVWNRRLAARARGRLRLHARAARRQGQGHRRFGRRRVRHPRLLAALDARTGREVWRFNTIPGPGERGNETWAGNSWERGGASVWVTGSYDPDLEPDLLGHRQSRAGLERRSARRRQPVQRVGRRARCRHRPAEMAFPVHAARRVRLRLDPGARARRHPVAGKAAQGDALGQPQRLLYVLDRTNGQFLLGKPFVKVNWTSGLDDKGRPTKTLTPTAEGTLIYPGNQGGTNWYSPSYSPRTGLFYIPSWMDTYSTYIKRPVEYAEGQRFTGAAPVMSVRMVQPGPMMNRRLPEEGYGAVQAFDPKTGEKKWEFKMTDVTDSGILTTASDLLFSGGREGYFFALDARTGALLWKTSVGGAVSAAPMSFSIGGGQHVAIAAGSALFVYALR